ncbi:Serine/threonine-protein kinase, partial [Clydaea vesicula]
MSNQQVKIGEYTVGKEIGRGSFATVYLGKTMTNQKVAVKSIAKRKLNQRLQDSLKQEINILKNINHKNIVSLYDIIKSEKHIHLIMEYCMFGDLSGFIKKKGFSDSPNLYAGLHGGLNDFLIDNFLKQLANAMEFLRSHSLIHRDLKPQNILLAPNQGNNNFNSGSINNNQHPIRANSYSNKTVSTSPNSNYTMTYLPTLKLADFGFARLLPSQSMASTLCGSPLYMAPEILRGDNYDAKADLWSLGAVVFEMYYGHPPFKAQNHIELLKRIEQATSITFPDDEQEENRFNRNSVNSHNDVNILRNSKPIPILQNNFNNNFRSHTFNGTTASPPHQLSSPVRSNSSSTLTFSKENLKDFIVKLLKKNPIERITFEEFFLHPAVTGFKSPQFLLNQHIPQTESVSLKSKKSLSKLNLNEQIEFNNNNTYNNNKYSKSNDSAKTGVTPPFSSKYYGNDDEASLYSLSPAQVLGLRTNTGLAAGVLQSIEPKSPQIVTRHNLSPPVQTHSIHFKESEDSSKIPVSGPTGGVLMIKTPFPGYEVDPSVFLDNFNSHPQADVNKIFSNNIIVETTINNTNPLVKAKNVSLRNSLLIQDSKRNHSVKSEFEKKFVQIPISVDESNSTSSSVVQSGASFSKTRKESLKNNTVDSGEYVVVEKDLIKINWFHNENKIITGSNFSSNSPNNTNQFTELEERRSRYQGYNRDYSKLPDYMGQNYLHEIEDNLQKSNTSNVNFNAEKVEVAYPPFLFQKYENEDGKTSSHYLMPADMGIPFINIPEEEAEDGEKEYLYQEFHTLNLLAIHGFTIQIFGDEVFEILEHKENKENDANYKLNDQEFIKCEYVNLYLGALGLYHLAMEKATYIWNKINNDEGEINESLEIEEKSTSIENMEDDNFEKKPKVLTDEEIEKYKKQLGEIVEFIKVKFNLCLKKAENFENKNLSVSIERGRTCERLLYERALELSHAAGINELNSKDLEGCEIAYEQAILLSEAILNLPQQQQHRQQIQEKEHQELEKKKSYFSDGCTDEDRVVVEKFVAGLYVRCYQI